MNAVLLIVSGALLALMLVLLYLSRTARRAEKISFWELALAFIVVSVLVLSQVHHAIEPLPRLPGLPPDVTVTLLGQGIALVLVAVGALIAVFEARRAQGLKASRGILTLVGGLFVLISTVTAPIMQGFFPVEPGGVTLIASDGSVVQEVADAGAESLVTATPRRPTPTPEPSPTFTPTPSRTPRPTASVTPTRRSLLVPTSAAAVAVTEPAGQPADARCPIQVLYNLRLREAPTRESETLLVIPFETTIDAYGRSDDTTWWLVEYDGERGWVDAEFTRSSPACDALPVAD